MEHEVDGGRDVGEEGLLQGRGVRQGWVLGDLKKDNALISGPLSVTAPHGKIMPIQIGAMTIKHSGCVTVKSEARPRVTNQ